MRMKEKNKRKMCTAVNYGERIWRTEEHIDTKHEDLEFSVFPADFAVCFAPVFYCYSLITLFLNDNTVVYPV